LFNKKMILMLVLLAAMVAGSANAGDYKVYGKLHTSIDYLNNSDENTMVLSSNTSRFGVKGSQEMNENFSFIWQFEQKLNIAQKGSETLANRNSFIGLTGNWGTFLGGIHDTPFKTLGRKATFFFDEIGDFRTTTMGWDKRLQDILIYASPDFSGFGFTLAYQMDQTDKLAATNPDDYEAKTAFSGNAMYKKDGLMIGLAIENLSKGYSAETAGSVITYGESQMGIRGAVKYTMDKFAVSALFQSLSDVGGVKDLKAMTMGLEAKFQFNPKFAFKGAFYMADPNTDAEDDSATTDVDESAVKYNMLALGIDHTFAKNIGFYAQYAMVMNDDMQAATLGGGWHGCSVDPSAAGENPNSFSVGSWFKF